MMTTFTLVSFLSVAFLSWSPLTSAATARQLQGQEEICFEGFVMDWFCIERGTLLDNPSVRTLEEPNRHSLHCLVDISRCVNSGYEMLMDPTPETNGLYARALRLNDFGNREAISLARRSGERGFCTTCTQELGQQAQGFRATVRGFLVPDSGIPQVLDVMEVLPSSVGCGNNSFVPENITTSVGTGGGGIDPISLHGGLMTTAWGFLLPTGVLSALFLRHRPNGFWFVAHRVCNVVGYGLAVIGIIVAFSNFGNVFEDGMGPSYRHGVIGLTTMICGLLQVVAGAARPHLPEEGEQKSTIRFVWEIGHRGLGYSTIVIAYATIYLGADVAGIKRDTFIGVFYGTLAYVGVAAAVFLVDKFTYRSPEEEGMTKGNDMKEQKNVDV